MDQAAQHAHQQFVNMAVQLTVPLIRNLELETAEDVVRLYVEVYDEVLRTAAKAGGQSQS